MSDKIRVGFDLDGVGYNFGDSVRRYLSSIGREYGYKDDAAETHTWNFYEYWGMDYAEFKQICHDGVDAGYIFSGPARDGAPAAIRRVHAMPNTSVHIITDRQFGSTPAASHDATRAWLLEHDIPYDTLTFSADKTVIPTDMFVEDKLENYDSLTAVGNDAYLINRPWNEVEGGDTRQRIDDITTFAEIVHVVQLTGGLYTLV